MLRISLGWGRFRALALVLAGPVLACGSGDGDSDTPPAAHDPNQAPEALIDRFAPASGTLQVRNEDNGLPAAGAPVDFDREPFITTGLGPSGERVRYYNFDVQSTTPAPIYVLFREGETEPVSGQLNIVDVLPGDAGYSDFWKVTKVTVPASYVANSATSLEELQSAGYALEPTDSLVNCPIVPQGSSARRRLGSESNELHRGWYRGQVAYYFSFEERPLSGSTVPLAPIYVTFNVNPDQAGGGPASGFRVEADAEQTHNVVSALPSSPDYSPLWSVNPYDNGDFDSVQDLASARQAQVLGTGVADVNCPVVEIGG